MSESPKVLTVEQVAHLRRFNYRDVWDSDSWTWKRGDLGFGALCDSHEALRARLAQLEAELDEARVGHAETVNDLQKLGIHLAKIQ